MNISVPTNSTHHLVSKDHLLNLLDPKHYSHYDRDREVHHIRSLDMEFEQEQLFEIIKNCSKNKRFEVFYHLEADTTACFKILSGAGETCMEIYIHGTSLIQAMEYLFSAKLSSEVQRLKGVKSASFRARRQRLSKKIQTQGSYSNYVLVEANCCKLHADSVETYRSGVAHIKYMCDSTQGYTWCADWNHMVDGRKYRYLLFEEDDRLSFALCSKNNGRISLDYIFFLTFNEKVVNNQSNLDLENTQLLHKLVPLCRSHRLNGILEAV